MSCSDQQAAPNDALDTLDDAVAAAAFRRLVRLLRHRHDAANIDLMGLAGFCRNCLGDWIAEAGDMDRDGVGVERVLLKRRWAHTRVNTRQI